jgi:hypothetical protein
MARPGGTLQAFRMRIAIYLVCALSLPAQSLPAGGSQGDKPLSEALAAPSSDEQASVILTATENALRYTQSLPDFLCTQVVTRYLDSGKGKTWKVRDTLQMSVAYTAGGERYKLQKVDGQVAAVSLAKLGGFQSHGEFGSLLRSIFRPEAAAEFQWQRWSDLRGRRAYVYSFHIPQNRSNYDVSWGTARKVYRMTTGLRGFVFVDAETKQVMRITNETEGIPDDWPNAAVSGRWITATWGLRAFSFCCRVVWNRMWRRSPGNRAMFRSLAGIASLPGKPVFLLRRRALRIRNPKRTRNPKRIRSPKAARKHFHHRHAQLPGFNPS